MSRMQLLEKITSRTACVGVIGLGYVGLPLAMTIARAGFSTLGFDADPKKIGLLLARSSYIGAVTDSDIAELQASELFQPMIDFEALRSCDVVIVCVPTPLTANRDPDLSHVACATGELSKRLRPGQLYVLESTTFPGTTTGLVKSILSQSGLVPGQDFFIGYSPEREDPGNPEFKTKTIPKVVAGDGPEAAELVKAFYQRVVDQVVAVSGPAVAEAVKLTENVFRAVNIALVNELKIVFAAMGIDIWEVLTAAKTKPFGYMPFYPGPGLGGHCVPIDPFYLAWAAQAVGTPTQFITLAGEVNTRMPHYVVDRLAGALQENRGLDLKGAKILLIGMSYKKNIADIRESPSLVLLELFESRGAIVDFHDPFFPLIPKTRDHASLAGRASVDLNAQALAEYDAVLIATDHDAIDYACLAAGAALIVDTRDAFASRGLAPQFLVKA